MGGARGPTFSDLDLPWSKRGCVTHEGVLQLVSGSHRSAEPVSKQTLLCCGSEPREMTP